MEAAPEATLSFDDALAVMLETCQRERCPELGKISGLSKALCHFVADSTAEMSVRDEQLCLPKHRSQTRRECLEQMLLAAENGMHFEEVQRRYSQAVPEDPVTVKSIHHWMSKCPSFLLWGLGTFKHKELVRVPTLLIVEIQQDVVAMLNAGDIPYVCLNGKVFDDYRDRLRAEGVPTPAALYSCMRVAGNAALRFSRYPYAMKKDDPGPRPTIQAVFEEFVSGRCGPVSEQQIRTFALQTLGVPAELYPARLSKTQNLLPVRKGLYLHASRVRTISDRLETMIQELSKRASGDPITEAWVYQENLAVCQALGIMQPDHLAALIKHFFPGKIEILKKSKPVRAVAKTATRAVRLPRVNIWYTVI